MIYLNKKEEEGAKVPYTENTPVNTLAGVGPKREGLLKKLGIQTVWDLLRHYPRGYEDWSHPYAIADAPLGEPCCVRATALSSAREQRIRAGMVLYRFVASDGADTITITIFNNKYAAAAIRAGESYLFYGTVTGNFLRREMSSPQIERAANARIRPLYPLTANLSNRMLETTIAEGLKQAASWLKEDPLPLWLLEQAGLCSRETAVKNVHFPQNHEVLEQARRRLVFEELFLLQLGLLRLKGRARGAAGAPVRIDHSEEFVQYLPFALTGAQQRAIATCVGDMRRMHPMNRLLQGDVGSGKTAVAAGVAFTAVRNGYQVAMMAPTEILAEQHYKSLSALLEPAGITVGLLTGSQSAAEKRAVREGLQNGSIAFAVGTHALLTEGVSFDALGLVITDEQHRFGVAQRAALAAKGVNPHLLVMSATPIPRTLALMVYGDLDVSVLDELPPGRTPVETYAVGSDKRARAYGYVRKFLDQGRQAYVVCPLVEENEENELASAEGYAETLSQTEFAGYRVGLLHGRMKGAEKERVMSAFAAGEIQVLVSTTVIEVGVDVPNAVIMVIENAERFGLAQLHQLRGRVGRGKWQSTCILISDAQNEEAVRRLKVLAETNDGFRIANEDLQLRGPGDFFGNRQHGLPELKLADLANDMALLTAAQEAARRITDTDPALSLPQHRLLALEVARLFGQVGENGLN